MKAGKNLLTKFLRSEAGDGSAEYGTIMAFSAVTVALVIAIFNAGQSGLIASLTNDPAAKMHSVAARTSATWN